MVSFLWVTYPEKNNGLIVMGDLPKWKKERVVSFLWVTYPGGRILSKLHALLKNGFNMRSLLATFLDECRSTSSLLAISNNLESYRAIPFTKAKI